jgi:hypothetical protein
MSWLSFLAPAVKLLGGGGGDSGGSLLGAGMGAISGAIGGGKSTQKVDQTTTQSGTQSSNGSSRSRRFMTDDQMGVMGDTGAFIRQLMTNPSAAVAPARTASINGVNNNFVGAGTKIRGKFMQSGGNASGKAGRASRETEMGRLGAINDTNLSFDQKSLDLQQLAAQLGLNFSNINMGQDAETNATATSSSTSNTKGTTTSSQPGGMLGGALNGGLSTLATLTALNRMMNGGGTGSLGGFMSNGDFGGET